MTKKKEMWLKNNTGSDVSLSDLGVKVLANQTTNIYAYNPYITETQVKKSIENGSIYKRLKNNVLSVVKGAKNQKPHTLDHIKTSSKVVEVVKSKSSIFINTNDEDVLEDEDLGSIADYGLGELGHNNTKNVVFSDGVVVVEQKKDEEIVKTTDTGIKIDVLRNAGVNEKTIVALTDNTKKSTDEVKKPKKEKLVDSVNKAKNSTVDMKSDNERTIEEDFDTKVATKDKSGAIVMKVKEYTED